MKKFILPISLIVISIISAFIFYINIMPTELEYKGNSSAVDYIPLCTSIVSLIAAILSLINPIIDSRKKKNKDDR